VDYLFSPTNDMIMLGSMSISHNACALLPVQHLKLNPQVMDLY